MAPTTQQQWTIEGQTGFDALKFNEKAPIPEVGDRDVLVKSKCCFQKLLRILLLTLYDSSCCFLNYRDLSSLRASIHSLSVEASYPVQMELALWRQ